MITKSYYVGYVHAINLKGEEKWARGQDCFNSPESAKRRARLLFYNSKTKFGIITITEEIEELNK